MNDTLLPEKTYQKMSCFTVMEVDFQHRCLLTKQIKHCHYIMNFFNYFEIMYCGLKMRNKLEENIAMVMFIFIVIYLMLITSHLIDKFILPALKILSTKLQMTEYVAGVTLLSLGNVLPDLIVNMMPIRGHSPIYTINLSNALAVVLLSGGMICFLRPFKINEHVVRDLLYLMFVGEITVFMIFSHHKTTQWEAIILVLLYFGYLLIIFVDLNLLRLTIKSLNRQIKALQKKAYSPNRQELIKEKLEKLREFEMEAKMVVYNYSSIYRNESHIVGSNWRISLKTVPVRDNRHVEIDPIETGKILYNKSNPKNILLFQEFLWSLMPIDVVDWKFSGWLRRVYHVLLAPIVLFCGIFIPIVDYRQDKHGWSKLLNCTQIMTTPFLCFVLIEAMASNTYTSSYPNFIFVNALWTLCVTVPLATAVFIHTRTDSPPPYHLLFLALTLCSSLLLLIICSTELEVLFCIIGLVMHMTEDFVASCIRSIAAATNDVIFNVHLVMQGYEKMAYAASLASPIFGITVCLGIPCYFNLAAQKAGSADWIYGEYGEIVQIFFFLAISTAVVWNLTLNFTTRRSVGIFSYILFVLFLIYTGLAEWDVVHEPAKDREFMPT